MNPSPVIVLLILSSFVSCEALAPDDEVSRLVPLRLHDDTAAAVEREAAGCDVLRTAWCSVPPEVICRRMTVPLLCIACCSVTADASATVNVPLLVTSVRRLPPGLTVSIVPLDDTNNPPEITALSSFTIEPAPGASRMRRTGLLQRQVLQGQDAAAGSLYRPRIGDGDRLHQQRISGARLDDAGGSVQLSTTSA